MEAVYIRHTRHALDLCDYMCDYISRNAISRGMWLGIVLVPASAPIRAVIMSLFQRNVHTDK